MKLMSAKLAVLLSLSYVTETPPHKFPALDCLSETTEKTEKDKNQDLAGTLYDKMQNKYDILALFFESYGEKHTGFYVERNFANEKKYLMFHADQQQSGKSAVIKVSGDFETIESVTLKKIENGKAIKEKDVSAEDPDVLSLYKRMLETSVDYIDKADITKHPAVGNFAKYNGFIKDDKFVSSLENLINKTGI